jgi:hypothetical protein
LNIKGQPIVNDEKDAKDFENRYGVKVFTKWDIYIKHRYYLWLN